MDTSTLQISLAELNEKISQQTAELLESVKNESISNSSLSGKQQLDEETLLTPALVNRLWLLKNGFDEAQNLLDQKDIILCLDKIKILESKLNDFEVAYPDTLLGIDMTRKLEGLRNKMADELVSSWDEIISLHSDSVSVLDSSESSSAVISRCPQLMEQFVVRLGQDVIKPLFNLEIQVSASGSQLSWKTSGIPSLETLLKNVQSLIAFCASLPEPLSRAIPQRWGTYVKSQLLRSSIPKLYPDQAQVLAFKEELSKFTELEDEFRTNGWSNTSEISQFISNFDATWASVRRERYLLELRKIYQQASPITDENRSKLVQQLDVDEDQSNNEDNDWDWDGDDDEEEETQATGEGSSQEAGTVVDLWTAYSSELEPLEPEPFFTLYRAITPTAYEENYILIYADTKALIARINRQATQPDIGQLVRFADENFHKYQLHYMKRLEVEALPQLFGVDDISSNALAQIRSTVDDVAVATNNVAGPDVRRYVLSQLVEQIAVYVISTVEQMADIGDSDSQRLAVIISKLSALGVYFTDPSEFVPSWTKLDKLREILTSNLATIESLHDTGMLADFSPEELTRLVKALFVDSASRRSVIDKLNSGLY